MYPVVTMSILFYLLQRGNAKHIDSIDDIYDKKSDRGTVAKTRSCATNIGNMVSNMRST